MKRFGLLIVALMLSAIAFAQNQQDRMKAAKVGFLTQKLNLTPEQAEKFWPQYNQFAEKRENVQIERRMAAMEMNKNGISEEEAKRMIDQELKTRQDELNLEKEFFTQIQKVLTPSQTINLIRAEREFNMEVLRNLRHRENQDGPAPGRNRPNQQRRPGN